MKFSQTGISLIILTLLFFSFSCGDSNQTTTTSTSAPSPNTAPSVSPNPTAWPPFFCSNGRAPLVSTNKNLLNIETSDAGKDSQGRQFSHIDRIAYEVNYVDFGISSVAVFRDGPKRILVEETFQGKWRVVYNYASIIEEQDGLPSAINVYSYSSGTKSYDVLLRSYKYVEARTNDAIYEEGRSRIYCNANNFVDR